MKNDLKHLHLSTNNINIHGPASKKYFPYAELMNS